MKKRTYLILILLTLGSMVFSQTITITNPNNRDNWEKNTRHDIRWNVNGEMNNKVKIRLFNRAGTTKIKDIVNNTNNSGIYRCPANIFNDVPDGDYKIRVKTIDNNFSDDSDVFTIGDIPGVEVVEEGNNSFPIGKPPVPIVEPIKRIIKKIPVIKGNVKLPAPSIVITHPPKDHNWRLKLGNTSLPFPIRVMWYKTGLGQQDLRVKIILRRAMHGAWSALLTQSTPNDGLWRGEISRDLMTSLYTIVIETLDGKIRVESATFYITNAENDTH